MAKIGSSARCDRNKQANFRSVRVFQKYNKLGIAVVCCKGEISSIFLDNPALYFPSFLRNNFPDCKMFNEPMNMNKAGARASIMKKANLIDARESGHASLPPADEDLLKGAVLAINPRAWAEMDV